MASLRAFSTKMCGAVMIPSMRPPTCCTLQAHLPLLTSVPTHPYCSCSISQGMHMGKVMPRAATLCLRNQKPLTPEHHCPPAAGPVFLSQLRGSGNGPRSPVLQKEKCKAESVLLHSRWDGAAALVAGCRAVTLILQGAAGAMGSHKNRSFPH